MPEIMPEYIDDTSRVTSVWSAYGHRFIGDGEGSESCLTCGAMYQLMARADDPTRGAYMAANGDEPRECSRDTGMIHAYPGEGFCHEHDDDEPCAHIAHDCNCIFCDS